MAELDPDQAPVMQDIRAAAVLLMTLVCGIKYRTFAHTHLLERRDWQLLHVAPQQLLLQMRSGGDERCGSEPAAWHTRAMQFGAAAIFAERHANNALKKSHYIGGSLSLSCAARRARYRRQLH